MDVKIREHVDSDFVSFTAVIDERGRITIPSSIRRKLRASFGSVIHIDARGGEC